MRSLLGTEPARARWWLVLCAIAWLLAAIAGPASALGDRPPRLPAEPALLQAGEEMRVLGQAEVSVLRDPAGTLGIDAVSGPSMRSRFEPLADGLNLAYTTDALWLQVELQRANQAPRRWRLELTTTFLDDVRLFVPLPGGGYLDLQAGDRVPFEERAVAFRRPVFDLRLPDEQPRVYYLRIRTESVVSMQFVLWRPDAFERHLQRDTLWIGGLLGMALLSSLFFFEAWVVNRYRLLLMASAANLAFALFAASNLGVISQYVLHDRPEWADALNPFTMALFFPLLCSLLGQVLKLAEIFPRVNRLQLVVTVLCALGAGSKPLGLLALFGGRLLMLGMLFGLAWMTLAAWLARCARRQGAWVALALTACTASFAVAPLIALGALPPTRHLEVFWVVACLGFVLIAQATVLVEVRRSRQRHLEAERAVLLARRDAEQALQWRRQQAQYFVGVAHDLRTPLSAARLGLANLERQLVQAAPEVRARLDRLQASLHRAGDMLERHLHLQRLEQPDAEATRVPATVEECLELVRAQAIEAWPDREVRVTVRDGVPATLPMDLDLVVRAIVNLLSNAARAAPVGTAIDLEVVADGADGVGFLVRDHGPGLRGRSLETLLEMHWRRPQPAAPRASGVATLAGFGVGLPLVHRIAQLHGGRVDYRRDGEWTEFSLWLPARV